MRACHALADAACNYLYASWYLSALSQLGRWRFASAPFADAGDPQSVLHVVLYEEGVEHRIAIDHSNLSVIDKTSLNWCHAYGKVNLRPEDTSISKVLPIGPLTAIRYQPGWKILLLAVFNTLMARDRIRNLRGFLANYRGNLERPRLSDLEPATATPDYIFFASSQWKKEPAANELRANFIRACRNIKGIRFEGGFAPRSKGDMDAYKDLEMTKRLTTRDYLDKTRRSAIVFNTPSVEGCNGWKYCELLMMGKALLTPPMVRLMPGQWEAKRHYQLCNPEGTDLPTQISILLNQPAYRQTLEQNGRQYFENELAAEVVMRKLMRHAKAHKSSISP